jgi:hypothetical protein
MVRLPTREIPTRKREIGRVHAEGEDSRLQWYVEREREREGESERLTLHINTHQQKERAGERESSHPKRRVSTPMVCLSSYTSVLDDM